MSQSKSRTSFVLVAVAVTALLAGTGGAIAGSAVTSAQIKNGTIKTKDLSAKAQKQLTVVGGYKQVFALEPFVGGDYHSGSFEVRCPTGTAVLSGSAHYELVAFSSTIEITYFADKVRADYIFLDDSENTGRLTAICGRVSTK